MSRRGLIIALIVSLAVNLFVLGGLAGAALMGLPLRPRPHGPPGPPQMMALAAELTPAQRDAWRAAVGQAAQSSGAKLRQARELRTEAWRKLMADPLDPAATLTELKTSRTMELEARSEMDRAVVGFAATLPTAERRKLAEGLSRARRGPPHGDWSGGRPGPHGQPGLPDR